MRIINLSKRFLNAFWAVPFVLIIRIIEPVLSIKILYLFSTRIGHFVCDSVHEAIKLEQLPKNVRHIYWFEEPIPIHDYEGHKRLSKTSQIKTVYATGGQVLTESVR